MKINEVKNDILNESYYWIDHPSGLRIYIYPKKGYSSTYAVFGTKYGSIDNSFKLKGDKQYLQVPEGIAHFLEHKLFENEKEDAFARYAKTGASANAYTSFDRTAYLFSCTENFDESLEILLDFVQSPYFTEQTVKKEQGIIGQEIKMYEDSPEWRVFFNLLCALYKNHPVRIDIAGTVESISKINADILYNCYNTFYNLHNMVLCVAGKVDINEALRIADRLLKKSQPQEIERYFPEEPPEVAKTRTVQKLPVSVPLFQIGIKCDYKKELSALEIASMKALLQALAGESSVLYNDLLDLELINDSFGADFFEGRGFSAIMFSGESKNPDAVMEKIVNAINAFCKNGIDDAGFERAKRCIYGHAVSSVNSVQGIANGLLTSHFSGREFFDKINAAANLTKQDVEKQLSEKMDVNRMAISIIEPINN